MKSKNRTPQDQAILTVLESIRSVMLNSLPTDSRETLWSLFESGTIAWPFNISQEEMAAQCVQSINNQPGMDPLGILEKPKAESIKGKIIIKTGSFFASFSIESILSILTDFEKEVKEPNLWKPNNRHTPREPFTKRKWLQVAEMYDSAEDILKDQQYEDVLENLKTAKATGNTAAIELWSDHAKKWETLYQHALTLNYEWIIQQHKKAELTRLAESNEAVMAIKNSRLEEVEYLSPVGIYALFTSFLKEPTPNLDNFLILYYANKILEEHTQPFGDTVNDFIKAKQVQLIELKAYFKDNYLKPDGSRYAKFKRSWRKNSRAVDTCDRNEKQIEDLENKIFKLLKYEGYIKAVIDHIRLVRP